jgi:hypothetical protein
MTKKLVSVEYGARHRAAIGICEQYDCFSFVVSETSGTISSVHGNIMKKLSLVPNNLAAQITEIFESNFNITNSEKPLGDSHIDEKLIVSSKRKTK